MQYTQRVLGDMVPILPVLHPITGCDTTSRPYGLGESSHTLPSHKSALGLQKNVRIEMWSSRFVEIYFDCEFEVAIAFAVSFNMYGFLI